MRSCPLKLASGSDSPPPHAIGDDAQAVRLPIRLPLRRGSDAISPTAHYTGHVWTRNGLSHPALATTEGRLFFAALAPTMAASRAAGGPTLEGLLLARHRIIDAILKTAIDEGRVAQIVEIAAGMSPRGWRFAERHGDDITYVEADLPDMAARKRGALERIGPLSDRHRVVEVDALRDGGERSLAAVAGSLDRDKGLAIVTEGLLTYFPHDDVLGMWRRFARELARFPHGLYLADIRLGTGDANPVERGFQVALSSFVGRRVHRHFGSEAEAASVLHDAGFGGAELHRADRHPAAGDAASDPAAARIHIVEARTG
jgi:O-methyltransferase involved in polyketide biosynthesis